jgi:cytochrome c553
MKRTLIAAIAGLLCAGAYAQDNTAPLKGNAEEAKKHISMCQGCHGIYDYKATFPRVYRVPMIGGQQPGYIAKALQGYKSGSRTQPNMRAIAESLSDQDIADLAAYYGSPQ